MTPEKRGLTREEAATYVGCSTVRAFDHWRTKGLMPGPMRGTKRWDRAALDRALDRLSNEGPLNESPLDAWLRTQELDHARAA